MGGVILLILTDNTLSFSYYYNTEKRIEQIQGINEIVNDTTLSSEEKNMLKKLRTDLIIRKTWKDQTYKLLSEIEFKSDSEEIIVNSDVQVQSERSYFWHFVSSGWIFLLVMIVMPFVGLADKNTSIGTAIGILIAIEPLFFGLAWLFAKVFSFIPILFGNSIVNYILNAILSFIILFLLTKLSGNKKKKTKDNNV
tara:strand:+ start:1721 stop:2308 length:588 start_codon:yes stop_codon:yes gene_type:complete